MNNIQKIWRRILFGKVHNQGNVSYWYKTNRYSVHQAGIIRSILIDTLDKRHNWASHPINRFLEKLEKKK